MSKKKVPDNFMQDFLAGKPTDPQPTDDRPTEDIQQTDIVQTDDAQKGETPRRQIRISDADWNELKRHFEARGLTVSAGIRMIVKEYLRGERT